MVVTEKIIKTAEPTVNFDFYITYAKEFAKNIDLQYNSTATEFMDNPITVNTNADRVTADIESRLKRYKNIEGFEYICTWCEKIAENKFKIYIGYA